MTDQTPGDDLPEELQMRITEARRDLEQAVADLRATMSDEEAREEFGIDVDRFLE